MRRLPVIFILVFVPAWAGPAHAQLFAKKNRPNPIQRVSELIVIVKTDGDERKRASAAEELREFDPKQFPEIQAILIDVAQNDAGASVRGEAINSLAKLRPVSQQAGLVMEQAAARDPAARVRWQAKTALWRYQLAGYSSKNGAQVTDQNPPKNGKYPMTQEPPLAKPGIVAPRTSKPTPLPKVNTTPISAPVTETNKPVSITPEFRPATNPRPLKGGFSTAVPQQPRIVTTPSEPPLAPEIAPPPIEQRPRAINPLPAPSPPQAPAKDEGPMLVPPKS